MNPAFPEVTDKTAAGVYLRPVGLISGPAAKEAGARGDAFRLAGGEAVFFHCQLFVREGDRIASTVAPVADILDWAGGQGGPMRDRTVAFLEDLTRPRPSFAGLPLARPLIMGVVNVTPDSFSDGGDFADAGDAIARGKALAAAGADILDIGGESTRPGARPVPESDELARVLPVIEGLAGISALISIDSRKPGVMAKALEAGAAIINDVTALGFGPESLELAAGCEAPVVLMHCQGDPRTMQEEPRYVHAALDVFDYLRDRVEACGKAGIGRERLAVDPGIGFGKTVAHNVEILSSLTLFHGLGRPIVLGVSRKSFIGGISGVNLAKDRLPGSLAAALAALDQGVQILRVHDGAETVQAVAVWRALKAGTT